MPTVSGSQSQRCTPDLNTGYEAPTTKPCRILLIEDQPVFRDAFETLLRSSVNPTELVSVGSLAQLNEWLASGDRNFDCVFIDLHLPDATDSQALLAAQEQLPHVPLVVMTGYASDPLRRRCLGLAGRAGSCCTNDIESAAKGCDASIANRKEQQRNFQRTGNY